MSNRNIWDDDSAKISEYEVFGAEAFTDEDYEDDDESDRAVPSGANEGFVFIDPDSLISPDTVVEGKLLYSARSYSDYYQYLMMIYGTPHSKLEISYDIETNAESPLSDKFRIIGFSISDTPDRGIYVIRESLDFTINEDDWDLIVKETINLFERADEITVHNIGYELPSTINEWGYMIPEHKSHDTMIMLRVTYPKEPAGLKPASARYLGYADWDAELGLYNRSVKNIIGRLLWTRNTRGARGKSKDFELWLNDDIFVRVEGESPEVELSKLKEGLSSIVEPTALVMDMRIVMEVLESNDVLTPDMWILLRDAILKVVDDGGLTTQVIPFSMIPSAIISRYGALDSIATSELKEFVLREMEVKSQEIRDNSDRISKTPGASKFNLYNGYQVVKKQFYAGQYLEMAGAHWDDKVATEERDWYNELAMDSWKSIVTNPVIVKEIVDMNRVNISNVLLKTSLDNIFLVPELRSSKSISDLYNLGMTLNEVEGYSNLSEFEMRVLAFVMSIGKDESHPYGNFAMTKSQTKFWGWRIEDPETGDLVVKTIRHNRFYEELGSYLDGEYLDNIVRNQMLNDVETATDYSELKKYFNPSSTRPEIYDMMNKALNTPEFKLAKMFDDLHQNSTNPREYDEYWKYRNPLNNQIEVVPGYESTDDLMEHIKIGHLDENGKLIPGTYEKFIELLSVCTSKGTDLRLMNEVSKSQNFVIEKLSEPIMIEVYKYYTIMGIQADDDPETWTDEFRLLYDFRVYKKCVKMITSYIDGRVGRRAVQLVDPDTVGELLPKRLMSYNEAVRDGVDVSQYDTLMTSRFGVGTADTGRWRAAIHCLHPDTEVILADGRDISAKDLHEEFTQGIDNYVYSLSPQGDGTYKFIIDKIKDVYISEKSSVMYKVTLDNGKSFEVTPNHSMVRRDGSYVRADELVVGDALYPSEFMRDISGYDLIHNPDYSEWTLSHHLAYDYNVRHGLERDMSDDIMGRNGAWTRHHEDFNKLNNNPGNVNRYGMVTHVHLHRDSTEGREASWRSIKDRMEIDPEYSEQILGRMRCNGKRSMKKLWNTPSFVDAHKERSAEMTREWNTDPDMKVSQMRGRIAKSVYRMQELTGTVVTQDNFDELVLIYRRDYIKPGQMAPSHWVINKYFEGGLTEVLEEVKLNNHKVVSIEVVEYTDPIDTYSISINPDNPTYALSCGVVSKNTVPSGSSIKNIYTSRFKGGLIASPDYCLVPETRIKLLDGTSPTIKELYETYGVDGTYEVYSYDHESNEVRPGTARHTRITKTTDKVYRVTLDNDKVVECTDNHPFLLRDGEYRRADELSEGDSLMPMYFEIDNDHRILNGYEAIYHPNGNREYTHHLVAGIHLGHREPNNKSQIYRHHINGDKLDNRSTNLELMTASEHMSHHMTQFHANPESAARVSAWMKKAWDDPDYRNLQSKSTKEQWEDPEYRAMMTESARAVGKRLGSDIHVQAKRTNQKHSKLLRLTYEMFNMELTEENYNKMLEHHGYKRVIRFSTLLDKYGIDKMYEMALHYNHKVKSIEVIDRVTEVYDLEVDDYHNFLIDLGDNSGIFVHNSQLEVRVLGASADEEELLQAFRDGEDVHLRFACFTGDTKVMMYDGTSLSFKELVDRYGYNEEFSVYSTNDKLEIVEGIATHAQVTRKDSELVEVHFNNGQSVKCTPDHKFRTRSKGYVQAIDLKPMDRVVALHRFRGAFRDASDRSKGELEMSNQVVIDKVVRLDYREDVYDIEVRDYHNFAVDISNGTVPTGAFVHNSITWNKPKELVTEFERRYSKMVTFALLYGADPGNIARNFMQGDIERATSMVNNFYSGNPKVKGWIDMKHEEWKQLGYVTLMTDRIIKIPVPDRDDPKYFYKFTSALRQAQNYPINISGFN